MDNRRQSLGSRSVTSRKILSGPISVTADKEYSPLVALNPYQSSWTIKVKVAKVYELRNVVSKKDPGEEFAVFSALLVDDQSTEIEANFWRDAAEYYHENLQEGKVYYFSGFVVKPANKKYSSVDSEYCINVDNRSTVEEALDQDTTQMEKKVELTEIVDLPKFVDQTTLVSVVGVVTKVASTGKVKRRADSSELLRRDITLVDRGMKSVNLTLWAKMADTVGNELENMDIPVVLIKNARVNSFNGISLSTVSRSEVEINPDLGEARQLQDWYELIGKSEKITLLSEGMAINNQQGTVFDDSKVLEEVDVEEVPKLGDKPTYCNVQCHMVYINTTQTMYYLACPENNRKVVEQDGKYFCEYNGQTYDSAELRYAFSAKIIDFTKSCYVNVFNDQGEEIIGMRAKELDVLRQEEDQAKFNQALDRCKYKPLIVRLKSEARENPSSGEVTLRHTLVGMKQVGFRDRLVKLLSEIEQYDGQD